MNEASLETMAPPYANLTLLLEIAMGVGLLIGALLARRQRFRQHAWCQSVIVLLNLAVIVFVMIPSFRFHVSPKMPLKLGKAYYALATAHAALGSDNRNRGIVHSAGRGHESFAGEIPHHQVQALDANRIGALVGRALVGVGNLRPLVRPAYVSKMNSNDVSKIIDLSQHCRFQGEGGLSSTCPLFS